VADDLHRGDANDAHHRQRHDVADIADQLSPTKIALMRRIKTAFDPAGVLNPSVSFD